MRYLLSVFAISTAIIVAEERAPCPQVSIIGELNLSYDNFHGIPDGSWNGNTGGLVSCNFGFNILNYLGLQLGGSYGTYDWYGKGSITEHSTSSIQQQEFVSGGIFRRSSGSTGADGLQGGIAVDWVFNQTLGIFGQSPNLGQLRAQLGYLWNNQDEFGALGTINLNTAHKIFLEVPISYRAVSQASLFWRHIFANSAEGMLWGGVPYRQSLMIPHKREGSYLIGFDLRAPLTSHFRLDTNGVFMAPVGNSSSPKAFNYDSNICVGITYSFPIKGFHGCSRCTKARPYLPLASNTSLLIDTNWTN